MNPPPLLRPAMLSQLAPERVTMLEAAGFRWAAWKRCFVHHESRAIVALEEARDLSEVALRALVAFRQGPPPAA